MSDNHINISHLVEELSTHSTYEACFMSQLALKGNFTTSELGAINWCCMSKGILFISNICNHKGTPPKKLAADTVTTLNLIHEFNWPRKHLTKIAAWSMRKK